MSYSDPQGLAEKNVALVYIAGKTSEARGVEKLLTQHGMTYTIKPTPFLRSSLFGGLVELPGVGFYVLAGKRQPAAIYCKPTNSRWGWCWKARSETRSIGANLIVQRRLVWFAPLADGDRVTGEIMLWKAPTS